jgi:hypothetical protein
MTAPAVMMLRRTRRRPGGGAGPAGLSIPSGNAEGQLAAERVPRVALTVLPLPLRV